LYLLLSLVCHATGSLSIKDDWKESDEEILVSEMQGITGK
jgi:hypothetical protein